MYGNTVDFCIDLKSSTRQLFWTFSKFFALSSPWWGPARQDTWWEQKQ